MPIYEYYCKKCKKNFEKLIKNNEENISCPHCGSIRVEKQLSTFSPSVASSKSATACGAQAACGNACCSGGTCPAGIA